MFSEGKVLFVPKIDSSRGEIDMLRVYDEEDLNSLIPKKWGIREPELYRNGTLRANGELAEKSLPFCGSLTLR